MAEGLPAGNPFFGLSKQTGIARGNPFFIGFLEPTEGSKARLNFAQHPQADARRVERMLPRVWRSHQ
jgi:hypothetical protein